MLSRLQKGDLVVLLSGKDKGKQGKITRVLVEEQKVVVEGLNMITRHTRPTAKAPEGGIIKREAAMHACKVMPIDPTTGRGTRVKMGTDDKGKKVRIAKSGAPIVAAKS